MVKTETISSKELLQMKVLAQNIKHIESNIYQKGKEVYKIFQYYDDDIDGYIFNKKRKLHYLLTHLEMPEVISPSALLQDENNLFCGYKMPLFPNAKTIDHIYQEDLKRKISILKEISQKLKSLHERNVLVVDFATNNILYNKENCLFCDVDSMVINDYPAETYPALLFLNRSIEPTHMMENSLWEKNTIYNKASDIFEINYLLLSLLFKTNIYELDKEEYLQYLKTLSLPKNLYTIFSHFQNMFYGQEEGIYPHEYLEELKDFEVYKKRKNLEK